MKALFLGVLTPSVLLLVAFNLMPAQTRSQPTHAQQETNCIDAACSNMQGKPTPCPEGTYSIGLNEHNENICKAEPTGCPYGDSIPLGPQCDKHIPQPITNESGAKK